MGGERGLLCVNVLVPVPQPRDAGGFTAAFWAGLTGKVKPPSHPMRVLISVRASSVQFCVCVFYTKIEARTV